MEVYVFIHACPTYHISHLIRHDTIILPVVLYGCKTWSLILKEERRLRVYENRVLRTVFVPKMGEETRL
jgi:hypothetical protein